MFWSFDKRWSIVQIVFAVIVEFALMDAVTGQQLPIGVDLGEPPTDLVIFDRIGNPVSLDRALSGETQVSESVTLSGNSRDTAQHVNQRESSAKQIAGAHKGVFYLNDFSYMTDPDYHGHHLGDQLKQQYLPGGGYYEIGGQLRFRYHSENNHRGFGLTGNDDQFVLQRARVYGDFHFRPRVRLYTEFIDAESTYENFGPRPVEVNRADLLNMFLDFEIPNASHGPITLRMGRQELMLGSQRVISPLDWANTRRTFEGVRVIQKRDSWRVDGFWTNPVRVNPSQFDSPDRDQEFMGIYASHSISKNATNDFYVLRHINGSGTNDFEHNTVGWRTQGSHCDLLWDIEANYQFGINTDGSDKSAGSTTMGLGRALPTIQWKPTLWLFYDYASGDSQSGNGYHHQFPLAHRYLGFIDFYGRSNIEDANVMLTFQPAQKLEVLAWFHFFSLATKADTPYSVAMNPFNPSNAPSSADLGKELDLMATYNISPRQNLVLGYSHFFSGEYYKSTLGVPFSGDASFYYAQWTLNF